MSVTFCLRRYYTCPRSLMPPLRTITKGFVAFPKRGDWLNWMQYFLNGVARQAEDALSRAERINSLLARWRNELSGEAGAQLAFRMLDMLGGNPFVTPRGAGKHLGLACNTVMSAIGQLEKRKIIKEVSGAKRARAYCAQRLLDILEEPAQLSPAGKF